MVLSKLEDWKVYFKYLAGQGLNVLFHNKKHKICMDIGNYVKIFAKGIYNILN